MFTSQDDIAIIEEENNASTNNPAIYRFRELQEYAFMGMWTLEGNNKLFNSFSGVTGKIRMKFFTEYMMPVLDSKYFIVMRIFRLTGTYCRMLQLCS